MLQYERIHHIKADIVPGMFVLIAYVAQAYDQKFVHAANVQVKKKDPAVAGPYVLFRNSF